MEQAGVVALGNLVISVGRAAVRLFDPVNARAITADELARDTGFVSSAHARPPLAAIFSAACPTALAMPA